jgi:hypothetical protein
MSTGAPKSSHGLQPLVEEVGYGTGVVLSDLSLLDVPSHGVLRHGVAQEVAQCQSTLHTKEVD